MSDQDKGQVRPTTGDPDAWRAYWKEKGWSWRTEPEIDAERQNYLIERRAIVPDVEKGIYPFGGIKLTRADVEWLLVTHENGRGPVDWNDESQREREGLDIRGVDLNNEDLRGLPLARLQGGLTFMEWAFATEQERSDATVHMEKVNFTGAHLESAIFGGAQLQEADFHETQLPGTDFTGAQLQSANFSSAYLWRAVLISVQGENANFYGTRLEESHLTYAKLKKASFIGALLNRVDLSRAQLEDANFNSANFERTMFHEAHLGRSDLRNALFKEIHLSDVILADEHGIGPRLADAQWNNVNLAAVNWMQVIKLSDELEARKENLRDKIKEKAVWLNVGIQFDNGHAAVRANRQLAILLQSQGMNEEAARFAYRAQNLQKRILLFQIFLPRVKFRQRFQAMLACSSLGFSFC